MTPLYVCIPVLRRYDLLRNLFVSLNASALQPEKVYVINNGRNVEQMTWAAAVLAMPLEVFTPVESMGIAESWNWFIQHVPEDRLICNDDIVFASTSLEQMAETKGVFISALAGSNACSCFILRDACVQAVGLFDETISPGYAYFEDCDYVERMVQKKIRITAVDAGVVHLGSQTIAKNTGAEWDEHHRRFKIAQANFITKWGRLPDLSRAGMYDD